MRGTLARLPYASRRESRRCLHPARARYRDGPSSASGRRPRLRRCRLQSNCAQEQSASAEHVGHSVLDVGRAESVRDLGPQARCTKRDSRSVSAHPHGRARHGLLRDLPAAGPDRQAPGDCALVASHHVVAQRWLDRSVDRQDANDRRPDLDREVRAPRFRHDRQPVPRLEWRRVAPVRWHSACPLHDAADLSWLEPPGVHRRRPRFAGLCSSGIEPRGRSWQRTLRRPPRAPDRLRPAPPRPRSRRFA